MSDIVLDVKDIVAGYSKEVDVLHGLSFLCFFCSFLNCAGGIL